MRLRVVVVYASGKVSAIVNLSYCNPKGKK